MHIRFLTSGESHGSELNVIVDGIPSNLEISPIDINVDLHRRQAGYGRGGRMKIEKDEVIFTGGVRLGKTIGGPVSMKIINKDFKNWEIPMSSVPCDIEDESVREKIESKFISKIRPGHADLPGAIKYSHHDIRNVLERASARETTSRVACGALCKRLLKLFEIEIYSYVIRIGKAFVDSRKLGSDYRELYLAAEKSSVRCPDPLVSKQMQDEIDKVRKDGDAVGGLVQVVACGVPVGLGSYAQWDNRLNARIAQALMSVHTVRSVEVGLGKLVSETYGSDVHDQIYIDPNWKGKSIRYKRKTNNAGGIEGGISNGEPIIFTASTKPIPTLIKTLDSVDIKTKENTKAHFERSDICVVPAAGVVLEAMMAYALTEAVLEKFSGDSVDDILTSYNSYLKKCYAR